MEEKECLNFTYFLCIKSSLKLLFVLYMNCLVCTVHKGVGSSCTNWLYSSTCWFSFELFPSRLSVQAENDRKMCIYGKNVMELSPIK